MFYATCTHRAQPAIQNPPSSNISGLCSSSYPREELSEGCVILHVRVREYHSVIMEFLLTTSSITPSIYKCDVMLL
ncbi:unnamed protein product [Strongylus vulgaris]|uniref:Uncharacterized protein n=1 Tax=Strongylus vulgaris TaxID=40348 RepID=A0A3P7L7P4_STRVU|nr:unnamed protein product [Strongylus vulgaris]